MLAVTTEVTVKLVPKPQLARCIMASFDDVRKAGDAVAAVIAAGIIPAGLEMMDKPMTARGRGLRPRRLRPRRRGDPAVRERRHARRGRATRSARMSAVLRSARRHAPSRSAATRPSACVLERAQERVSRRRAASAPTTLHGRAPSRASAWPTSCSRSQQMEKKYGLRCANVFHAGDGNLHPLILFDANDPDELHRAEPFGAEILETQRRHGRHHHRRARRGRREAQLRCACSSRRPSASRCSASSAPSIRPACSTPAR